MPVAPYSLGALLWAVENPEKIVADFHSIGATCAQLGIPGDLDIAHLAPVWRQALGDFPLVSVACSYLGEAYDDIQTVINTVGFIPPATRAERVARTLAVSDFAASLGIPSVSCHIGYPPADHADPNYLAVRDDVRRIADHLAKQSQIFALETGQESATELNHFLDDVARDNVRINFDPANMILYGTGDPIEALGIVAPRVYSVHCKDGDYPTAAGSLGTERPLGQGSVGIPAFIAKLKEIGYQGPLIIEREVPDHQQRLADMKMGLQLLKPLV